MEGVVYNVLGLTNFFLFHTVDEPQPELQQPGNVRLEGQQ